MHPSATFERMRAACPSVDGRPGGLLDPVLCPLVQGRGTPNCLRVGYHVCAGIHHRLPRWHEERSEKDLRDMLRTLRLTLFQSFSPSSFCQRRCPRDIHELENKMELGNPRGHHCGIGRRGERNWLWALLLPKNCSRSRMCSHGTLVLVIIRLWPRRLWPELINIICDGAHERLHRHPSLRIAEGFPASGSDAPVIAIDGLDFHIRGGEMVAIVGQTGCGKSTFLNMLIGLDRPTAGQITIGARRPYEEFDYFRGLLATVFQQDRLASLVLRARQCAAAA